MKKMLKKSLALLLAMSLVFSLAACGKEAADPSPAVKPSNTAGQPGTEAPKGTGEVSQGVTDDEILIGCTMASTGTFAFIGVPIVDAMNGVFARLNAEGGIRGRQVKLVHYDDGYDAATGQAMVEKLTEEDKVFALNCLGGNIVGPCLDYLKDFGIPVVNVTSGLKALYEDNNPDSAVFPVQPSGYTDGKMLLARTLHEDVFGANKDEKLPSDAKIGVLHGTAESSMNTLEGITEQAAAEGATDRLVIETVTAATYSTAIQKMKEQGVQAVLNTLTDSKGVVAAMDDAGWEVPYIGAYGTSTTQSYSVETYKPGRPIYCTTWAEYTTEEGLRMLADLADALTYNKDLDTATLESYQSNNYACAGYFAAMAMVTALKALDESGLDLTWDNLKTCIEGANMDMDGAGFISYANGARLGVTELAFTEYVVEEGVGKMLSTRSYESLESIMAK